MKLYRDHAKQQKKLRDAETPRRDQSVEKGTAAKRKTNGQKLWLATSPKVPESEPGKNKDGLISGRQELVARESEFVIHTKEVTKGDQNDYDRIEAAPRRGEHRNWLRASGGKRRLGGQHQGSVRERVCSSLFIKKRDWAEMGKWRANFTLTMGLVKTSWLPWQKTGVR